MKWHTKFGCKGLTNLTNSIFQSTTSWFQQKTLVSIYFKTIYDWSHKKNLLSNYSCIEISQLITCSIDRCNRYATLFQPHLLSTWIKAIELKQNVEYIKYRQHVTGSEYLLIDIVLYDGATPGSIHKPQLKETNRESYKVQYLTIRHCRYEFIDWCKVCVMVD